MIPRVLAIAVAAFSGVAAPAAADDAGRAFPDGFATPSRPFATPPVAKPPAAAADPSEPAAKPQTAPLSEAEARAKAIDDMLGRLATTEDAAAGKRIASAVQAIWLRSGSDTADLLTARAMEAQQKQRTDVALKLLDQVVSIKPDFAEAWNRRATVHFMAKDYDRAMADIHETLVREPRHFGAWAGLGRILRDSGLDRQALAAFRKALDIYPSIDGLKREVETLTLEVEGRPI